MKRRFQKQKTTCGKHIFSLVLPQEGGGGWGYSYFFRIRRLGPSIYRPPPKISGFKHPQKNIWNFSNPKTYLNSVHWPHEKTLKCIEMTLKLAQLCDDPPKISTKSSYLPKNIHLSENSKKYWNSEFWTQKNSLSQRMCQNIRVPPPPPLGILCGVNIYKLQKPKILRFILRNNGVAILVEFHLDATFSGVQFTWSFLRER